MSSNEHFEMETLITQERRRKLYESIVKESNKRTKESDKLFQKYEGRKLSRRERDQFALELELLEERHDRSIYLRTKYISALELIVGQKREVIEEQRQKELQAVRARNKKYYTMFNDATVDKTHHHHNSNNSQDSEETTPKSPVEIQRKLRTKTIRLQPIDADETRRLAQTAAADFAREGTSDEDGDNSSAPGRRESKCEIQSISDNDNSKDMHRQATSKASVANLAPLLLPTPHANDSASSTARSNISRSHYDNNTHNYHHINTINETIAAVAEEIEPSSMQQAIAAVQALNIALNNTACGTSLYMMGDDDDSDEDDERAKASSKPVKKLPGVHRLVKQPSFQLTHQLKRAASKNVSMGGAQSAIGSFAQEHLASGSSTGSGFLKRRESRARLSAANLADTHSQSQSNLHAHSHFTSQGSHQHSGPLNSSSHSVHRNSTSHTITSSLTSFPQLQHSGDYSTPTSTSQRSQLSRKPSALPRNLTSIKDSNDTFETLQSVDEADSVGSALVVDTLLKRSFSRSKSILIPDSATKSSAVSASSNSANSTAPPLLRGHSTTMGVSTRVLKDPTLLRRQSHRIYAPQMPLDPYALGLTTAQRAALSQQPKSP